MLTADNMHTARIEARELHEDLVAVYALFTANADIRRVTYRMEDVERSFRDLAAALGYRVERVEAATAVCHGPGGTTQI